ncbi:MAG: DNA-directed RNA polymerase subunit omega [Planctomycetes bacterium]|nr:DNA-directed RNA polymerase subunit omega [Planctomycetota bacterium]
MIEELKNEQLIQKAGGKFRLTALVQRRMGELLQGSRPLIEETQGRTLLEIVIQEILQDKIAIEGSAADGQAQESNVESSQED